MNERIRLKLDLENKLKPLRLKHEINQTQLAELLGISKSMVSSYEKGTRAPSFDTLIRMSEIFGVPIDYFFSSPSSKTSSESINTVSVSGLTKNQIRIVLKIINAFRIENDS